MIKIGIACFLGGFVFGIFLVAVLGWINDVHEDKEKAKALKEIEEMVKAKNENSNKENN